VPRARPHARRDSAPLLTPSPPADNTGYDLKQLFIGAEGTLGVVTAVSLLAPARPASVQVAFLALSDFAAVLATAARARRELSEVCSAVEFLDRASLELCLEKLDGARDPLPLTRGGQYMVIEASGSNAEHDREKLESFLQNALESGEVLDGTVAADTTQARALWRLREGVTEALVKTGVVYKCAAPAALC
jgi:FAD/FMN-containing dehydrogenase